MTDEIAKTETIKILNEVITDKTKQVQKLKNEIKVLRKRVFKLLKSGKFSE